MQRFYLQIGDTIAVFLYGKLANRDLRNRWRERSATDVITLFTPEVTPQAIGFKVIECRKFVEGPVSIYRSGTFEVRPQDNFGFEGTKKTSLGSCTEAVIVDLCREFLRPLEGFPNGSLTALVASKGKVGTRASQRRVYGGIDDLIEGLLQGRGKLQTDSVPERVERPPLWVIGRRILFPKFVFDALQGASLSR